MGRLLGIDERLFLGILSHETAGSMARFPQPPVDGEGWRRLLHALIRAYHGEETAAALAIPESPFTSILPLLAAAESRARGYQMLSPTATEEAVGQGIALLGRLESALPGNTAYQAHVQPLVPDR